MGVVDPYSTLNPDKTSGCNISYCPLFYEQLVQLGPNGKLEPELATSVGRPNPVTYIYHLRHGVTFWDGDPMTSADVVYSIDYQRAAGADTDTAYTNVKVVKATNRYTVVMILKHPDAAFKFTAGWPGMIFEKKFEQAHPTTFGEPEHPRAGDGTVGDRQLRPDNAACSSRRTRTGGAGRCRSSTSR